MIKTGIEILDKIQYERAQLLIDEPHILNWDWESPEILYNNFGSFCDLLVCHSFFPEPEITEKLMHSKLLRGINNWVVDYTSIEAELSKLSMLYPEKIDYTFYYWPVSYIYFNVQFIIQRATSKHSSNDSDYIKSIDNYFTRRRKSPLTKIKKLKQLSEVNNIITQGIASKKYDKTSKKLFSPHSQPIDYFLDLIAQTTITMLESNLNNTKLSIHDIKGLFAGEANAFLRLLNVNSLESDGKKKLYRNLFPFFQVIIKNKILFSKQEYEDNIKVKSYDDYDAYQISTVKTILGKTRK